MPYRKKKTGTKKEQKVRYTASGEPEYYYVDVDVFEDVYESDSSSYSGTDNSTSYGSDPGGYGGYSE